ncbi:oxygenase [Lithospermum erythrorhizon]|uniref:Oxygenase n=1 Tax=Lithospermum erythrorhizon TaxID=34254 RepID=A0AAV3PXF1_LITER
MIVHLILFSFTTLLIVIFVKNSKRKNPHPPGPPGLPILGNLHQFEANNTHVYLWRLSQKYGPIMSLKLGSVPTLVISSAKMAKEVLKTYDSIFASRPKLLGQQRLSYNGLDIAFCPLNEYLREMRRLSILHLFGTKQVQSFRPIREDEVSRLVKKISNYASSGEVIDLSKIMMFVASSFICRVAFGKRYEEGGLESRRFDQILHEAQAMMNGFYLSDYIPSLGWLFDKVSGMISRLEKNFKELDSFYEELIQEHLNKNRNKSTKVTQDIIDILLQVKNEQSSSVELTLDHIKAMLMIIFIAGTDTSAALVTWTMTVLMKTPLAMKRVQAEIRESVGNKGFVEEQDLQKLLYFKAIIKETLRLYTPVPLLVARETIGSCIIDGYEIQPKTLVFVNVWAIGRDPEYWDNPCEFLPERFLTCSIDYKGQDFGLIPFGSGRRICPGLSLGMATVESALANLLYSFDWELPPGMKKEDIDMDAFPGITMHKKTPLTLIANAIHC